MHSKFFNIIILIFSSTKSIQWTVPSLARKISPGHFQLHPIHDPDQLLKTSTISKLEHIISKIKKFNVKFILTNSVHPDYYANPKNTNLGNFVSEFSKVMESNLTVRDNSLIILYALKDRKFNWQTGLLVKKELTDKNCEEIADSIKENLKDGNPDLAFINLFENLKKKLKNKNYVKNLNGIFIFFIIMIVFTGFVALFFVCSKSKKLNKKIDQENINMDTNKSKRNDLNQNYVFPKNRFEEAQNNSSGVFTYLEFDSNIRQKANKGPMYDNTAFFNNPLFEYPTLEENESQINNFRSNFVDNNFKTKNQERVEIKLRETFQTRLEKNIESLPPKNARSSFPNIITENFMRTTRVVQNIFHNNFSQPDQPLITNKNNDIKKTEKSTGGISGEWSPKNSRHNSPNNNEDKTTGGTSGNW